MKIAMIGTGYVGLVSGTCFADFGHMVVCVDRDAAKIAELRQGRMPIYEPGLQQMVAANVEDGRLTFTTEQAAAVDGAEVVFIAVGTPQRAEDGHADLAHVFDAAAGVARALTGYAVIVTKSTVPVGTADEIERIMREANPKAEFAVASNPEFLREGAAIRDFKFPDRIVIGTTDQRARDVLAEVYRPLYLNQGPIQYTGRRTAELIKYAANAFLATKISFINEIADLCEVVGADIQEVARGIGADNRIGAKFLHAGPGYGGSCFPKDTTALIKTAHDHEITLRVVETVAGINEQRKRAMGRRVIAACGGNVRGKTIAILGLTFKPNTDDIREAPALSIVRALKDAGAHVTAFDPKGMPHFKTVFPDLAYATDPYACVRGAVAVAIVTEWEAFRALDLRRMKQEMAEPVFLDLRNIYRPAEVRRHGFAYFGIGRGAGDKA